MYTITLSHYVTQMNTHTCNCTGITDVSTAAIKETVRERRAFIDFEANPGSLWPNSTVPYIIDKGLRKLKISHTHILIPIENVTWSSLLAISSSYINRGSTCDQCSCQNNSINYLKCCTLVSVMTCGLVLLINNIQFGLSMTTLRCY